MKQKLDQILEQSSLLWKGSELRSNVLGVKTGYSKLDEILPEHGWPRRALIEIVSAHQGIGEIQLFLPLMAELTARKRWVVWIRPPFIPYPPALQAAGVDLRYVLVIKNSCSQQEAFWSMEKLLASFSCGLVLCWSTQYPQIKRPQVKCPQIKLSTVRRLQLAAESGQCHGVIFTNKNKSALGAALCLQLKPFVKRSKCKNLNRYLYLQVLKARGSVRYRSVRLSLPVNKII